MKIALVHEFLNQLGGAEQVLKDFLEIWPDADVHVILYNKEKTHGEFERFHKKISWLSQMPLAQTHPRLLLTLMPGAIEGFDFSAYDLVLSDSSSFAKGIKTDKLHICYCHTPTRFLWTEPEYIDYQKYSLPLKFLGKLFLPFLKRWDYKAAQRPNFYIANSANVQNRIKKYYNRDSVVIFPPIDTEFYKPLGEKKDYFFTVSRLEPYKRVDLIIEAFNELGWPLKIAGTGTMEKELKAIAKPNIEFVGRVSNEELRKYYSEAKAFLFSAVEDAGMTVVEAQAAGTPVIAYRAGGALETIVEGETGEFFDAQTPQALVEVLKNFKSEKFDSQKILAHALRFDKKIFRQKIRDFVENKVAASKRNEWLVSKQVLPEILSNKVATINRKESLQNILLDLKKIVDAAFGDNTKNAESFYQSRFIDINEALDKKIRTCGTETNIYGTMLRALGFPVKYVHGKLPGQTTNEEKHSWLKVYYNDSWETVDVRKPNFELPSGAMEIKIYHDWSELKPDYFKGNY